MSSHHIDPLAHPEVAQASAGRYIAGFITSILLMLVALIVTQRHHLPYPAYAGTVAGLALLAIVSQAALFFGLDLTRAQIWKSVSLVLTVPLFVLTVGLTVWMFQSLATRTMIMPPAGMSQPTMLE